MTYFPINVDIHNRACIIIGGGPVALRKAKGLLSCDASVTVISPEVVSKIQDLADAGALTLIQRGYQNGDLHHAFLVIAATDDENVQEAVHQEASQENILLNVADVPKWCNFILPATARQGDLAISISTHGQSPALAKRLRQELQLQFGKEYDLVLQLMGGLRPLVLAMGLPHEKNKIVFEELLHPEMIDWLKESKWDTITHHLKGKLPNADLTFLKQLQENTP